MDWMVDHSWWSGLRGFFGAQRPLEPNLGQTFIELCCVPGHVANSPPRPPIGRGFPVNQLRLPSPSKWGFPGGSDGKDSAHNAGDPGSTPGSGRSPEKGMATHSSILAWRIPGTEEPGRLRSTGCQRVRLSD